jgi:hypothetical protein
MESLKTKHKFKLKIIKTKSMKALFYVLETLGIIASISLVVCALCYIVAPVPIDGLSGFLPDSGQTEPSRTWLSLLYAAGLVIYALAAAPVVDVCTVRCYSKKNTLNL